MTAIKYIDIILILCVLVVTVVASQFYYFYAFSALLVSFGLILAFCKRLKDRSLLASLFDWIGSNLLVPRNKFNHIIWGIISILLGLLSFFKVDPLKYKEIPFDDPNVTGFENWWYKDPLLYIVIGLLVVIGIYRSRQ